MILPLVYYTYNVLFWFEQIKLSWYVIARWLNQKSIIAVMIDSNGGRRFMWEGT